MSGIVFRLLLSVLLALLLIVAVSVFIPSAMEPTARAHLDIPSLLQSTGGLADQPETLWLGYVMGVLMITVMGFLVWIGLRKNGKGTPLSRWMMGGFGIYILIFSALTYTYAAYTQTGEASYFGGFPVPTAWMIYGIWLFPLVLITLYVLMFDRWVLTKDDLASFQSLVQQNQRQSGGMD